MRYAIEPSKIAKDLGWHPETDFETGINSEIKRIFLVVCQIVLIKKFRL